MRVDKEWGFEEILVNGPLCAKFLHVQAGKKCSLHYHHIKDETFYVLEGECRLQTALVEGFYEKLPVLKKGESRHIPAGLPHRFSSKEGCVLLEVSTHHDDADVFRVEPSGNI
jgi:mannose-6-phosphate isomerase-like protein (cupin superfamily)